VRLKPAGQEPSTAPEKGFLAGGTRGGRRRVRAPARIKKGKGRKKVSKGKQSEPLVQPLSRRHLGKERIELKGGLMPGHYGWVEGGPGEKTKERKLGDRPRAQGGSDCPISNVRDCGFFKRGGIEKESKSLWDGRDQLQICPPMRVNGEKIQKSQGGGFGGGVG